MQMTEAEIVRRYKNAADRRKQIKILAELNACSKETIREILRNAGCDVPATGNRYTAAAKREAQENRELKTEPSENDNITAENDKKPQETTEKCTAPTRCQPAQPVDVWSDTGDVPEVILTLAKNELLKVEDDIANAEIECDILQATIDNMTEVANQIKDFLRKAEGRQA